MLNCRVFNNHTLIGEVLLPTTWVSPFVAHQSNAPKVVKHADAYFYTAAYHLEISRIKLGENQADQETWHKTLNLTQPARVLRLIWYGRLNLHMLQETDNATF